MIGGVESKKLNDKMRKFVATEKIKGYMERVNLRGLLAALVIAIVGVGFLYFSASKDLWEGYEVWQTVVQNIGALFLVS